MRVPFYVVSPVCGRFVASAAVCALALALFAAAQPDVGDDGPAGTPTRAAMAGWEHIRGDVETATVRVIYELFVRPERSGLYTITRYRVTRKADGSAPGAHDESEKYIWNVAFGQPLRCFAREKSGGWRALAHATREYQAEMVTAMSVYALHRQATLAH